MTPYSQTSSSFSYHLIHKVVVIIFPRRVILAKEMEIWNFSQEMTVMCYDHTRKDCNGKDIIGRGEEVQVNVNGDC